MVECGLGVAEYEELGLTESSALKAKGGLGGR